MPLSRSRAERFDDLVLDAVERLDRRWGDQLAAVEFAVEQVPDSDPPALSSDPVPLARVRPATGGEPARIVLYRRPLENRAEPAELPALVHDVVVEHFAELLGLRPGEVDPQWDDPDAG